MSGFIEIPLSDIRDTGPVQFAIDARERAFALGEECLGWLPGWVRSLLPAMDAVTRRWLRRSRSPYVGEIESISRALGYPGIWFLNGTYQWGCTALARDEDALPWLVRTLDWPFPGLGRRLEITRMRGTAGEFFNVTWPGYVGALTASAPGRFAAAINQAPLWRRTGAPWLRPYDLAANAIRTWSITFCPPDHLLREVFERCRDFDEARHRLETVAIARPVIFTLVGTRAGERCVIERTEQGFSSRDESTWAANDWLDAGKPWEARISPRMLLRASCEEAAANSRARCDALSAWSEPFCQAKLAWVMPPVLNPYTRCAIEMCPARGILAAAGYEIVPGDDLPSRVTQVREVLSAPGHETATAGAVA
jgi:hypothetical protein